MASNYQKVPCVPFGEGLYEKYKDACDKYFISHTEMETRGVGGIFLKTLDYKTILQHLRILSKVLVNTLYLLIFPFYKIE